ncbi:oxidoreductase [Lactiplantibacillus fabifermentans T30PCM01]|uniref:Oxidoreductase n=1 Tax=Lactiplantibacillus fabifermentans T30PCM01 TaxID=1400520 RepID=W6TBG1_9LACO|nr:SDR family oxidoreductase [Lactiplantibacillus fabifermentans]ETY72580.1 oxidoreductase [Lactiplantibacillus fabifermentans T30PCM01]
MTSNKLQNKVAIVTGGGSGIGKDIALKLAQDGAQVIITGRTEATLADSASQHDNIDYQVTDVTAKEAITALMDKIKTTYGHLDILVNNAGVAPVTPLRDVQDDEITTTFNINVFGIIYMTQAALPLLQASQGNIINISSTVADRPMANMSVYSASKAAVRALTVSWAKELAPANIRVNTVNVGPIETPIYDKTDLTLEEAKAHHDGVAKNILLGHFGQPADIANAVAFLASDDAGFVTAADYKVDGGFLA